LFITWIIFSGGLDSKELYIREQSLGFPALRQSIISVYLFAFADGFAISFSFS